MHDNLLLQLIINGLIIDTVSQVVNFAQGEFLLIGAWTCWWLLTAWDIPFFWGFLIAVCFMMVFGIAVQMIILRPLIGEPIISVIMVTIGMSIFFQALMKWMFGTFAQPFPPIFPVDKVNVMGLQVQTAYLMSTGVSLAIMAGFAWFFKYSRMGLAMRATAFSQQVAQSLGISVRQVFALSWGISAAVSAIAGVVVGIVNGVSSALSYFGIKVFPAVILGGLDSIFGAVVGGLIIGLLENLGQYVDSQFLKWGNLYEIIPFYALIIILMIKPYGLFGTRDIERV